MPDPRIQPTDAVQTRRPHGQTLVATQGSVAQLALTQAADPGWVQSLWKRNLPVLAARSLYSVSLYQPVRVKEGSTSGGGSQWQLTSMGHAAVDRPTAHFAWNHWMTQRALLLCEDGSLQELVLEQNCQVLRTWNGVEFS
jgi:hypothetical protein